MLLRRQALQAAVKVSRAAVIPSGVRCTSTASLEDIQKVPASVLESALRASGIDARDCVHVGDLALRVHSHFDTLPLHARGQITDLIRRPTSDLVRGEVESALSSRVARLFADEQYAVHLFQAARPSVTHIMSQRAGFSSPLQMDPERMPAGTGSGLVWDTHGHIVTNFHVIQDSTALKVTLSNQRSYDAVPVGVDPNNDIAVLKVNVSDPTPALRIGTSHDLMVGQKVFAIGNPFGLDQTLTGGIVSGLDRQVQGVTRRIIRNVIQTDASINPGNSGGPLLDSQGRLVGINTMIYSPSGASAGIGFAVPVNTVRRSVSQIIEFGRVQRGRVGLALMQDETNRQLRKVLSLPAGVIIQGVVPSSGAAQAGLRGCQTQSDGQSKIGDMITAVGGERVTSSEDVIGIVEQFSVGDQVPMTLHRGDSEVTVNVPVTAFDG